MIIRSGSRVKLYEDCEYVRKLNIDHDYSDAVTYTDFNGNLYYIGDRASAHNIQWKNLYTNDIAEELYVDVRNSNFFQGIFVGDVRCNDGKVLLIDYDKFPVLGNEYEDLMLCITQEADISSARRINKDGILNYSLCRWKAFSRVRVNSANNSRNIYDEICGENLDVQHRKSMEVPKGSKMVACCPALNKIFTGDTFTSIKCNNPDVPEAVLRAKSFTTGKVCLKDSITLIDNNGYVYVEPFRIDGDDDLSEYRVVIIANRRLDVEVYSGGEWKIMSNGIIDARTDEAIKLRVHMEFGDFIKEIAVVK